MKRIVGGALFRDGKLLLVKRAETERWAPGQWEIPGGKCDDGENDEEALRREFMEETGVEVKVGRHYNAYKFSYYGIMDAEENDYMVASATGNYDVRLNPEEHSEYRWAQKDETIGLDMPAVMKETAMKTFEVISGSK